MMKFKRGIGIVELLFSVTIILLLALMTLWYFGRGNASQALIKDADGVRALMSEARSLSIASKNAVSYGVHVETNKAVLFTGSSYSSSDPNNQTFNFSSFVQETSINLNGGGSDIVFSRLTGSTDKYGTVTLSRVDGNGSATITILSTGVVQ